MSELLLKYLLIASGLPATTYGYNEKFCGDIGKPVTCSHGAITASGEPLNPDSPTAAIFSPTEMRLVAQHVYLRTDTGPCVKIRLTDKGSPKYIGIRSFDLTPAAVELLTGLPATRHWSGVIHYCQQPRSVHEVHRNLNYHPLINVGVGPR
jgi:hypothetical protein